MSKSIIVPARAENDKTSVQCGEVVRPATLHDLFPEEINFFTRVFVWSNQTKGFYTRQRYEAVLDGLGKKLPKWRPFKTQGRWQCLYSELVDSLVEKHLDFERFCQSCRFRDRLEPSDSETAFWLGMMAGRKTYADCIDLDSHDTIGWNPMPTRWHESRTGWFGGPYDYRYLPVVRPSLRFFQVAKVIYDSFPGRIWTFSSANLGLAVWQVNTYDELTHVVYRGIENQLQAVGLPGIEHYPRLPKKPGSLGKCHRRPCGMDSAVITRDGLITDPIDQIRVFMRPPQTPPFEHILAVYWDRLEAMYQHFVSHGESLQHTRLTKDEKRAIMEDCREVMAAVEEWSRQGYVLDWDLIQSKDHPGDDEPADEETDRPVVQRPARKDARVWVPMSETEFLPTADCPVATSEYPDCFHGADLKTVAGSSQWVQYVKFLVENGIPAEDKFCEVISTLALWFGFVELFGTDRQRIKDVLRSYVLTRHNGRVTRLIAGEDEEAMAHVDRVVDNVLDGEDSEGKELFAQLRQKRATGQYSEVYQFEAEIIGGASSSSYTPNNLPLYLICEDLILDDDDHRGKAEWRYEPDLTPLPDDIISRVRASFQKAKRQLRQDKTTGRYPTLDAITRLFNYVFSGRKTGSRRASQKLLVQMGFVGRASKRTPIFDILEGEDLLYRGGYRATSKSRLWTLDKTVIEAMWRERMPKSELAS